MQIAVNCATCMAYFQNLHARTTHSNCVYNCIFHGNKFYMSHSDNYKNSLSFTDFCLNYKLND